MGTPLLIIDPPHNDHETTCIESLTRAQTGMVVASTQTDSNSVVQRDVQTEVTVCSSDTQTGANDQHMDETASLYQITHV